MAICEYCSNPFEKSDVQINTMCVVNFKNNIFEFGLKVCSACFGRLGKNGRDIHDRIEFPKDGQLELYKIKKYRFPPNKKQKPNEEWKLFAPLIKKGKKSIWQA
jgi:uncharacterized UBP type Zn finger protein